MTVINKNKVGVGKYIQATYERNFLLSSKTSCESIKRPRLLIVKQLGAPVCLFLCVLSNMNLCRLFNAKSIFIQINSSISSNSV